MRVGWSYYPRFLDSLSANNAHCCLLYETPLELENSVNDEEWALSYTTESGVSRLMKLNLSTNIEHAAASVSALAPITMHSRTKRIPEVKLTLLLEILT